VTAASRVHVRDGNAGIFDVERLDQVARGHGTQALQASAHQFGDGGLARPGARREDFGWHADFGLETALRVDSLDHGQAFGANPVDGFTPASLNAQARGTTRENQLLQMRHPARALTLLGREQAKRIQRIVELVGVRRFGPGLRAHLGYRRGIEFAHVRRRFRIQPAALRHRVGAALFERRVIEEGIGPRAEDFRSQW